MKSPLLIILTFLLFQNLSTTAQNIGISADKSMPDSSAMLDIKSNSKGLLIPRMTKEERNAILKPAKGLMVFQTNDTIGFWYYNSEKWNNIQDNLGNHSMSENLKTNGNIISKNGDNVGIQVKDSGTVSIRTIMDIGYSTPIKEMLRFDLNGGILSKGNLGVGKIPMEGEGDRFMWYPFKNAFRTGFAFNEYNDVNIGFYSWAGGSRNIASGMFSFSFGEENIATASNAIAMGKTQQVYGANSFAAGAFHYLGNDFTSALGGYNRVWGKYGTALGFNNIVGGDASTVAGAGLVSKAYAATVVGMYNDSILYNNTNSSTIQGGHPLFIVGNGTNNNNRSNALVVNKDGTTAVKDIKVNAGIQIGNGTRTTKQQSGTAQVGNNSYSFKTMTVTFPSEFSSPPMVIATVKAQAGTNYNDTFVVSVRSVSTTEVTFNIVRVDSNVGWGQFPQLDWLAWTN